MADETTQTPPIETPPAAPAFDADALASQVAEKLKGEFARSAPQPAPQPTPRAAAAPDPMRELIGPYVEPAVRAASLAEEAASDAIEFYGSHPELEKDERAEVEKRFKTLRANGVPFRREDIYNHYLGENIEKVVEKRISKRNESVSRAANAATTVGSGSPDKNPHAQDARAMDTAALGKALEGVSF